MGALPRHQRVVIALSFISCAQGWHGPQQAASTWPRSDWRCAACSRTVLRGGRSPFTGRSPHRRTSSDVPQGVTAAFNGIVRQLRRAGRYEEETPSW